MPDGSLRLFTAETLSGRRTVAYVRYGVRVSVEFVHAPLAAFSLAYLMFSHFTGGRAWVDYGGLTNPIWPLTGCTRATRMRAPT
jgi:hypothetical protein